MEMWSFGMMRGEGRKGFRVEEVREGGGGRETRLEIQT